MKAKPLKICDLIPIKGGLIFASAVDEAAVAGYLSSAFRRTCSQSLPQSRQLPGDTSTCQSERLPMAISRVRAVTQHVPSFAEPFLSETSPGRMTLGRFVSFSWG